MAKKILVIEDDQSLCKLICKKLNREGFGVVGLQDSRRMAGKIMAFDPDVVITDMYMPGNTGNEVISYIISTTNQGRAREKQVQIIVITDSSLDDAFLQVLKNNAIALVPKPIDFAHLMAVINNGYPMTP